MAAAKAAFSTYSRSTPQERYEALKKISDEILARKDELGRLLSREEGKTLPEGIGEVVRAGQIFAFFAGESVRTTGEKIASTRPGKPAPLPMSSAASGGDEMSGSSCAESSIWRRQRSRA